MIRVGIEVDRGAAPSTTLFVRAGSIRRAFEVAGERHPDCSLNVAFPLDPDTFFVPDAPERVESEIAA